LDVSGRKCRRKRFAFTKAAAKVGAKDMGRAMADLLIREQVGEQATTAMQSAYEAAGRGGLRPGMTLEDYINDAITTAKVTLGQSLLMGGAAAGVRKLATQPAGLISSSMGSPGGQLADALNRDSADLAVNQDSIDAQARAAMDPNRQASTNIDAGLITGGSMPAETNFTPTDAPTRAAGLTDIVLPMPQAPTGDTSVSVPDAPRTVAGVSPAGLGPDNLGGLADPGRAPSVDVRTGADAGGAVAGAAAPEPVGVGSGRPGSALTDPIRRTSDADLLSRIPQEPAQTDALAPPAADQALAATVASPTAPTAPGAGPDRAAIKAADAALKAATQRADGHSVGEVAHGKVRGLVRGAKSYLNIPSKANGCA